MISAKDIPRERIETSRSNPQTRDQTLPPTSGVPASGQDGHLDFYEPLTATSLFSLGHKDMKRLSEGKTLGRHAL